MKEVLETIPQAFYDLIARILPGFFFLFLLRLSLWDFGTRRILQKLKLVSGYGKSM